MRAGSIYLTVANSGYQSEWVGAGALECCSNMSGLVSCGSSSGVSVSSLQNVTIDFETSYQYIFNISECQADGLSWLLQGTVLVVASAMMQSFVNGCLAVGTIMQLLMLSVPCS